MNLGSPRRAARQRDPDPSPFHHRITYHRTRDAILFLTGIAGIIFVTVTEGGDRPTLLLLFGAMVGLPAFIRGDEKNKPDPPAITHPPAPVPEDA